MIFDMLKNYDVNVVMFFIDYFENGSSFIFVNLRVEKEKGNELLFK